MQHHSARAHRSRPAEAVAQRLRGPFDGHRHRGGEVDEVRRVQEHRHAIVGAGVPEGRVLIR